MAVGGRSDRVENRVRLLVAIGAGAALEPVDVAAGVEHHVERLRRSPDADSGEVLVAALANARDDRGGKVLGERNTQSVEERVRLRFVAMEEKLIQRLESAVSHLEVLSLSGGGGSATARGFQDVPLDPSIVAYEDLIGQYLGRVSAAAEKILGGGRCWASPRFSSKLFLLRRTCFQVKQDFLPG
ncbi:hypothetical protein ACFX11_003634 [Malus domestica]